MFFDAGNNATLFAVDLPDRPEPALRAHPGPFAGVALERSIDRVLDYAIPARWASMIEPGQRLRVPLGKKNRSAFGYVVEVRSHSEHKQPKELFAIDDDRVLVTPRILELARWMSRYYVTPLGAVIDSIIPSAVKKRTGLGHVQIVRAARPREEIQAAVETLRAPKRRAILARLLLLEPDQGIELNRLASESGSTAATVRKLHGLGWITVRAEVDLPRFAGSGDESAATEKDIALNEDQQNVINELIPRMAGGFSVNLIQGVTGSGKTEVYLQCIRNVLEKGKQALILVPEIALTPQTVRRFSARFSRVAILHSGLSSTARHRYWQQIASGHAQVVVGARSAVFAPLPDLGVIVVDEEHEASYKQDSVPRYNGRDVAIKRAQIEQIPVILGSATPSLESFWNVTQPRTAASAFHLLKLPRRVRGLAMPAVELIDMKVHNKLRRGVHLISQRLEHLLHHTFAAGEQAILLLNRRGYSNFVSCPSCSHVVQCKYCDTTMTYHRAGGPTVGSAALDRSVHTGSLHCHYCMAVNKLPDKCPDCGKKLSLFGLGTQRVEEELKRKFPDLAFARVDSDTMRSSKDYELLLNRFGKGEIQMLLGTQMIAKGLDYPNVTLVGVISGDTALALPDFRAAERTFQLITQVAGRAGRGDRPGRVVLQTFLPHDPTIQFAIRQDFDGFAAGELKLRREVGLPPLTRMVRIILRDQDADAVSRHGEAIAALLIKAIDEQRQAITLRGPMPCAISRIAGYFRNQIVMTAAVPEALQGVLAQVRKSGQLTKPDRVAVDVDPVSLL